MPLQPASKNQPVALHERAIDDIRFIRQTMERATSFTAVPGWGVVAVGVTGTIAAFTAHRQPSPERWLIVWLATATLAVLIAGVTIKNKAERARVPLSTGPGRTFLVSFLPSVSAAAVITVALYAQGLFTLMPGIWLLLYGAAVLAAGSYSVKIVPIMGITFMLFGLLALATPGSWGDLWQGAGFGGLHILFGFMIARRYGG